MVEVGFMLIVMMFAAGSLTDSSTYSSKLESGQGRASPARSQEQR